MNALAAPNARRKISQYELPDSLAKRISCYLEFNSGIEIATFKALLERTIKSFSAYEDELIGPDVKTAQEIERRYQVFLKAYVKFSKPIQLMVLAGIRYFVERNQNTETVCALSNFDDDIRIINYILHSLGAETGYLDV